MTGYLTDRSDSARKNSSDHLKRVVSVMEVMIKKNIYSATIDTTGGSASITFTLQSDPSIPDEYWNQYKPAQAGGAPKTLDRKSLLVTDLKIGKYEYRPEDQSPNDARVVEAVSQITAKVPMEAYNDAQGSRESIQALLDHCLLSLLYVDGREDGDKFDAWFVDDLRGTTTEMWEPPTDAVAKIIASQNNMALEQVTSDQNVYVAIDDSGEHCLKFAKTEQSLEDGVFQTKIVPRSEVPRTHIRHVAESAKKVDRNDGAGPSWCFVCKAKSQSRLFWDKPPTDDLERLSGMLTADESQSSSSSDTALKGGGVGGDVPSLVSALMFGGRSQRRDR